MPKTLYEKRQNSNNNHENQIDNDSWNYHYHQLIISLEGNDIQKETIIRKRILRYFGQFKLDSQSYLSIRNDIDYTIAGVQIIPQKLILYGVDYLTIQRAKNYFSGFITNILRIDDSHFMVQFRNQIQCLSAINKCKKRQQNYSSPQDMFKNSNKGWVQMKSYHQFIFQRKLMGRYATNLDKTDNIAPTTRQSCAFAYAEAKRRFMKSLKQDLEKNDRMRHGKQNKQKKIKEKEHSQPRQRSRQKNLHGFHKQNKYQESKQQCRCQHRIKRYASRSRSRSPSRQSIKQRGIQSQKIRQSDFKFELYIKRRDQKTKSSNQFDPSMRALNCINKIHQQNMNETFKNSKDNSINNDNIDVQIISGSTSKSLKLVDPMVIEFEKYLQKLKLDDSKNQYTAFDVEQID